MALSETTRGVQQMNVRRFHPDSAIAVSLALLLGGAGCTWGAGTSCRSPEQAIDGRTLRSIVPAAYHEFAAFGDNAVYLSHYPVFSSIHAYQAIFEAKLSSDGSDAERLFYDFQKKHPTTGLTLSPARDNTSRPRERHDWVLPEKIRTGHRFNADLWWVENDDDFDDLDARQYVATNVTVEVTRIVHFQMFHPDTPAAQELVYLVFGKGEETYLAHLIESYPGFDQLLRVKLSDAAGDDMPTRIMRFRNRRDTSEARLKEGEAAAGVFLDDEGRESDPVRAEVIEEISFDQLERQQ
jgi:hypothetical protein